MKRYSIFMLLSIVTGMATAQEKTLTTNTGAPVTDNQHSKTIGQNGAVLLEDIHLIEKLAAFDRERIPERVVHARGAGAYGEFITAAGFSHLTAAKLFSEAGKKTPVFVRFSTVIHGQGSPETVRDPRGFATKFYTEEGNYDIVGNNLPVFFIRDAIKFPDMVHSLKPSPVTNKQDPNRVFDFFSHIPEATHMLLRLYSDYGTPANYRQMDGSSVHAFKWVNEKGEITYVKYTWKTKQGEHNFSAKEAAEVQGKDFQHATTDLYSEIKAGHFPQWDLYVQMIKASDLDKFAYSPLDPTKVWDEKDAPLVLVGTMTLNRVPNNFFEEVEQAAFSPATLVPGIEPSEDKLLQGRLFSYFDTQRYRLGVNFQYLPVNAAKVPVNSNNQDGAMSAKGKTGDVNYEPSVVSGSYQQAENVTAGYTNYPTGQTTRATITKQNDYEQAGLFYRSLDKTNQAHLISNLVGDLSTVTNREVVARMIGHFYMADRNLGMQLAQELKFSREEVEKLFAQPQH